MDPNGYRRLSHPKNAGEDCDVIRIARTYTSTYTWDLPTDPIPLIFIPMSSPTSTMLSGGVLDVNGARDSFQ